MTQTIRGLVTSAAYRRNTAYVLQFATLFKNIPKENLRCIEWKLPYLLLKRWKWDVYLVFVPGDHSRRVGPHVAGYVRNEKNTLHRVEIALPFVEALERICLPGACTSWPQQAGWPTRHRLCPPWEEHRRLVGSIDRRSCRTDYLCVTSLLFSLCRMISMEYQFFLERV